MTSHNLIWICPVLLCVSVACTASTLGATNPTAATSPAVSNGESGIVDFPAMQIPFSSYGSAEALAAFVRKLHTPKGPSLAGGDISAARAFYDKYNRDLLEKARRRYAVNIEHRIIGGVDTDVVTPANGVTARNRYRVLINLHGGAFLWGAGAGGQLEATPIAALMGVEVVTIDYREAPEHHFPAASEDVASVYRQLLKTHSASSIGIYGCSAGGILTAESVAWLQHVGLPKPGAVGIFCGAGGNLAGDSVYLAQPLTGEAPMVQDGKAISLIQWPYFMNASEKDPLVAPVRSAKTLRQFPPTLLISGTRDFMLSAVIDQHNQLVKVGVDAELHLWDGMWHAFFMDTDLPESREVFAVIAKFFDRHLTPQRSCTLASLPAFSAESVNHLTIVLRRPDASRRNVLESRKLP